MTKVMLVEDEAIISMRLAESLAAMGYEVAGTATSGEEAVDIARQLSPDVILMDIVMPGELDGITAAEIINEQLDIPVIFLTAYTEDLLIQRAKHVEPFGYIVKPLQEREIKAAIEVAIYKKEMERRLQESEERFALAVSAGRVGVWDRNLETGEMYVYQNLKDMLGYKDHEIPNHLDDWCKLVHPDDVGQVMNKIRAVLGGEEPHYTIEHRMLHKDGSIRWFVTSGNAVQDKDGKPYRLMGTTSCITERKRTEEALRESEARFRNLLEYIPRVSIRGYTADGIVQYWNRASEEVYGYTAEEAIGMNLGDLIIPPELKPHFRESLEAGARAAKSGEFSPEGELMLLHKDGHLVPVHSINTVVCLEDTPPLMFCLDVDLSERKRAEEELKNAHDDLEKLVEGRTAELVESYTKLKKEVGERKQIEKELRKREAELRIQTNKLAELNSALKVLLKRREEDRIELEESVLVNVNELVLPYLEKVRKGQLEPHQLTLLAIIESHLNDIVSPFTVRLSAKYSKLSPMEIKIANLVKEGRTTKDIAELLDLSENTIKVHRFQIRSKLGLKHKKINLSSFLRSLN
jgi:PAS domain S-box-containing protein